MHDRTIESRNGLTALVRAVARANMDGMPVEIDATPVLNPDPEALVPSVSIDGIRVEVLTTDAIYVAIARAHRRPVNGAAELPAAMLAGRSRR